MKIDIPSIKNSMEVGGFYNIINVYKNCEVPMTDSSVTVHVTGRKDEWISAILLPVHWTLLFK